MTNTSAFEKHLICLFGNELTTKIMKVAVVKHVEKDDVIVHEGHYLTSVPFMLEGVSKIYMQYDSRSFLLHYVTPFGCCVMPFSAVSHDARSRVSVIACTDAFVFFIPTEKLLKWIAEYPIMNEWLYRQYNEHENEMLSTINSLLFDRLEMRLLKFLTSKAIITGQNPIIITHKEIALEMGTVREVVTRLLKKLHEDHHIVQHPDSIEILSLSGD
jgi:CRP/FNR family transcriptional regulator